MTMRALMKKRSIRYFVRNWAQRWFPSLVITDYHKFTPSPSSLDKFYFVRLPCTCKAHCMEKIELVETPLIAVSFFFYSCKQHFLFTFVISVLINVRGKFPVPLIELKPNWLRSFKRSIWYTKTCKRWKLVSVIMKKALAFYNVQYEHVTS